MSPDVDLGPSVIPEFAQAVGLDELVGRGKGRPSAAAETMAPPPVQAQPAPPPPPPDLPEEFLQNALVQVDALLSSSLSVAPEDEKVIISLTKSVYPLANHYAKGASSLAALWTVAVVGLAGYGLMKYKKVADKPKEPEHGTQGS